MQEVGGTKVRATEVKSQGKKPQVSEENITEKCLEPKSVMALLALTHSQIAAKSSFQYQQRTDLV